MATAIATNDYLAIRDAVPRIAGLSPWARLLLAELLNYVDRRTGHCWPSEARLAEALNCCVRTVQRAKRELRDLNLITWQQRGRHRNQTPLYRVMWPTLMGLAKEHTRRVKEAAGRFPARMRHSLNDQLGWQRIIRKAKTAIGTTEGSPYPCKSKNIGSEGTEKASRPLAKPMPGSAPDATKVADQRLWQDIYALPEAVQAQIYDFDQDTIDRAARENIRERGNGVRFLLQRLGNGTAAMAGEEVAHV